MSFSSNGIRTDDSDYFVDGDLTIHGVTKPVTLKVEANGFTPDAHGGTRTGFSATTEINRNDFGVVFNGPIPGTNAVVLSEKVSISLEVEAVLRVAATM